jgi:hypothetical protein
MVLRACWAASTVSFFLLMSAFAAAAPMAAYVDMQRGVIIGGGEAVRQEDQSFDDARLDAIKNAKVNVAKVLGRQPVDLESIESKTLDDYLSAYPSKRIYLDSFLDSAEVFKELETGGGKVEVTLILPIEGPNGYRTMLGRMTGKTGAVVEKHGPSTAIGEEEGLTEEDMANRNSNEIAQAYKFAILPFVNKSDYTGLEIGNVLSEQVTAAFQRDRHIVFVSGDDLDQILADNKLDSYKIRNSSANSRLAIKGIDGLICGAVTRYVASTSKHGIGGTGYLDITFTAEVDLRVLDAKTGRWVYFNLVTAESTDRTLTMKSADDPDKFIAIDNLDDEKGLASKTVSTLVGKVVKIIRNSFPIEGYVLKVAGNKVYISFTRSDGLKEDDQMSVYRLGEMLENPVTGAPIDRIKDRLGTIKAVDVKETYTQCVTSEIPSEPIKPGDVVMIK